MFNGKRSKMGKLAHEVAKEVDGMLADEEAELIAHTTINLESLRPQISDQQTYDKLIAAVQESTRRNESMAQLKSRISALGEGVQKVAKEAITLINRS